MDAGPALLDADREAGLRQSFARQTFMDTLGAHLIEVRKGQVRIGWTRRENLRQQHGFLHAGVAAAILDSACGYAAISVAPDGMEALTVEFKTSLLRPASGERFEAVGSVIKAGKNLVFCAGEAFEIAPNRRLIAAVTSTLAYAGVPDGGDKSA
jgi:uncharacterized protein (TIGR00369 family)